MNRASLLVDSRIQSLRLCRLQPYGALRFGLALFFGLALALASPATGEGQDDAPAGQDGKSRGLGRNLASEQEEIRELIAELRRPNHTSNPIAFWEGVFRRVYNTDIDGIESAWLSARR